MKTFAALALSFALGTATCFGIEYAFAQNIRYYWITASWCGPCQQMKPYMAKYPQIQMVDFDRHKNWCQRAGVRKLPTLLEVQNGVIVERIEGFSSETQVRRFLVPGL